MRQAIFRKKKRGTLKHFFLVPLVVLLAAVLSLSYGAMQKAPENPGAAEQLLRQLLMQAMEAGEYAFAITESDGTYNLHFRGEARGQEVFGTFEEYDLQVYAGEHSSYVRKLPGGTWLDIEEEGLSTLSLFARSPLSVLRQLADNDSSLIVSGPGDRAEAEGPLVFLVQADAQSFHEESLVQVADAIREISFELSFDPESLRLMRLDMDILIAGANGESRIRRTCTFSAESAGFPPDLPVTPPGEKV